MSERSKRLALLGLTGSLVVSSVSGCGPTDGLYADEITGDEVNSNSSDSGDSTDSSNSSGDSSQDTGDSGQDTGDSSQGSGNSGQDTNEDSTDSNDAEGSGEGDGEGENKDNTNTDNTGNTDSSNSGTTEEGQGTGEGDNSTGESQEGTGEEVTDGVTDDTTIEEGEFEDPFAELEYTATVNYSVSLSEHEMGSEDGAFRAFYPESNGLSLSLNSSVDGEGEADPNTVPVGLKAYLSDGSVVDSAALDIASLNGSTIDHISVVKADGSEDTDCYSGMNGKTIHVTGVSEDSYSPILDGIGEVNENGEYSVTNLASVLTVGISGADGAKVTVNPTSQVIMDTVEVEGVETQVQRETSTQIDDCNGAWTIYTDNMVNFEKNTITISWQGMFGIEGSETITFDVFSGAPTISADVVGDIFTWNNTNQYFKDPVTVSMSGINASDNIKAHISDAVITVGDSTHSILNDGDFVITEDIHLDNITVTYLNGESSTVNLDRGGDFILDNEMSQISQEVPEGMSYEGLDGKTYYKNNGKITFKASDDLSGIKEFRIDGAPEGAVVDTVVENSELTLDITGVNNFTENKITVVAIDQVGNEASQQFEINKFIGTPDTVRATVIGTVYQDPAVSDIYFSGDLSVGFDSLMGEESILKHVEKISIADKGIEITRADSPYTVSENTSFSNVTLTYDNGATRSITFETTGDFVKDETEADVSVNDSGIAKYGTTAEGVKYVKKDGQIVFTITDDQSGLSSVEVSGLGDTATAYNTAFADAKSATVTVDTSTLEKKKDYSIVITATDHVENTKVYRYTLRMWRDGVDITQANNIISCDDIITVDGKSYFSNSFGFEFGEFNTDEISNVTLLKDGEEVRSNIIENRTVRVFSEGGHYTIRVTPVLDPDTDTAECELTFPNGVSSDIYRDTEEPYAERADFTGTILDGLDGVAYITDNGVLTYRVGDLLSGVGSYGNVQVRLLDINGNPVEFEPVISTSISSNNKVTEVTLDTTSIVEDSEYTVEITATDNVGNVMSTPYTDVINLLRATPTTIGHADGVASRNGKSYASGDVTLVLDRVNPRVRSAKIVNKSSLAEIPFERGSLDEETGLYSYNATITESGSYKLRITDMSGRETEYELRNVITNCEENIIIDTSVPTMSFLVNGAELSGDWVIDRATLTVNAIDNPVADSCIDRVSVEINGETFNYEVIEDTAVFTQDINLRTAVPEAQDGLYKVKAFVYDLAGNKSQVYENTIKFDYSKPTVSFSALGEGFGEDNGVMYIENALTIIDDGCADVGSGIATIEYLKDGVVVGEGTSFTLRDSGEYSIRVTDNAGLSTTVSLEDVLDGFTSSNVVVDANAPSVNLNVNGNKITSSWLTGDAVFGFDVKEDNYIKSVSIKINNFTANLTNDARGKKSYSWSKTLKDLPTPSNGLYQVTVTVEDLSGHQSVSNEVIRYDYTAPVINARVNGERTVYDGKIYIKEPLTIINSGSTDIGSGVNRFELYKDGVLYNTGNSIQISDTGSYMVRVYDTAGLYSIKSLADIMGIDTSEVVMDTEAPTAVLSVNGSAITNEWLVNNATLGVYGRDNIALDYAVVTVNEKSFRVSDCKGKTELNYSVNLKDNVDCPDNGRYNVTVEIHDVAGNVKTETSTVYFDYTAPVVKAKVSGKYNEFEGKLYVDGALSVTNDGSSDVGSGVKSFELLKDGVAVDSLSASEDGHYTVKVTDISGLSTEVELSEFIDGVTSSDVLIDTESPVISRVSGFEPNIQLNGYDWYKEAPVFGYRMTDKYINTVSVKINNEEKLLGVNSGNSYLADAEGYEGTISVRAQATDKYGHVTIDDYTYKTDFHAPVVDKADLIGSYNERLGVMFFKADPQVKVTAHDTEIGLDKFILAGSKSEENTSGTFTLGTGEFTVEVTDKIGNTTNAVSVKDLCKLNTNKFIVDGVNPVIEASRPAGDYNGWYATDVEYKPTLKDNQGIHKATISINGKVVTEYTSSVIDEKEHVITANTKDATADSNGMYHIIVSLEDNAGNVTSWEDSIYIDRTAPVVEEFLFTGNGYMEGEKINGKDKYGFYFTGAASCRIKVSDGTISSGMKNVYVTLEEQGGKKSEQTVQIKDGYATVSIPNNFKGFISAYADDNVNNKGTVNKPDGVITEDANWFINNLKLDINLPTTQYKDKSGYPLYAKDFSAEAVIGCGVSGIREVKWGIGDKTSGTITIDNNGKISGDSVKSTRTDKNLILNLTDSLNITGNENNMKVWVEVKDRVGRTSKTDKQFSIDKDVPKMTVTWNNTEQDNYYKENRVATVTVEERNFDPQLFKFEGNYGEKGSWSEGGGNKWTCQLTFAKDDDYRFSISGEDRAGNQVQKYTSDKFTVDKTKPTIRVSWNNNNASNGFYYNKERTATITVNEHNFDSSRIKLEGSGSLGGWSGSGDTHTATIRFSSDGEYKFTISGTDLADNEMEVFDSGDFVIDTSNPTLEIVGVQNGVSYKKEVGFSVNLSDDHIDIKGTHVTLVGKRNGEMKLTGTLNTKTGTFTFADFPMEEAYDDVYTLHAYILDMAGNYVEDEITFSVNRFGSAYSVLSSDVLNTYGTEPKDIQILETNVDKLDISKARVAVLLNGNEIEVPAKYVTITETEGADGKFNYTYTISKAVFSEDGKYLIQIYSQALEGTKYSSISEEYTFVLDTVSPDVIISGIKEGETYHEYSKKVVIEARDTYGIADVRITLNGETQHIEEIDGVYTIDISESGDLQSLVVMVRDMAGNQTIQKVENFRVTSSWWSYLINQMWFKASLGAISALVMFLLFLILKNRRDSKNEEEQMLKENVELYKTSAGSSNSSSSTTSGVMGTANTKDEVEDLDK